MRVINLFYQEDSLLEWRFTDDISTLYECRSGRNVGFPSLNGVADIGVAYWTLAIL